MLVIGVLTHKAEGIEVVGELIENDSSHHETYHVQRGQ